MDEHEQAAGDPEAPEDPSREEQESPRRRRLATTVGPAVLILLMLATAIFAAVSVTPDRDEGALARPADSDLILAGRSPISWDPARISDAASAQVLSQIYEGLTVLDVDARVRPALAESWTIEDDGRRIIFELRPGITFSDGTAITAEDFRRSWLRVLDPDDPSPLASMLDDVVGARAFAAGATDEDSLGIHAEGQTLSVEFDRPAAYFPSIAAVPTLAVVPASLGRRAGGPTLPLDLVSSGAYIAVGQTPTDLRLAANADYWAGTVPIDRVTVVTDTGGRSSVDIFEDEAVDWTRISSSDASWIRYDRLLGPQLRKTDELVVDFLGFDTARAPFDDIRVRQAFGLAVDWRRLGRLGDADVGPVTSMIPPGIPGRSEGDFIPAHDPEAARELLDDAGYPEGSGFPKVVIATYGVGETAAIAEELRRELSIDVTIERRPFGEHSRLLDIDTPSMWTLAWSADYPHPHDFLGLLLRGDSSSNVGAWQNSDFDGLIDAAAATDDQVEQERLYAAAQEIVRDEVPLVPLGYGGTWALSRDGLTGADPSGVGILRYAGLAWDR
jgi:oligopeptide transport system substrate-binding protein